MQVSFGADPPHRPASQSLREVRVIVNQSQTLYELGCCWLQHRINQDHLDEAELGSLTQAELSAKPQRKGRSAWYRLSPGDVVELIASD